MMKEMNAMRLLMLAGLFFFAVNHCSGEISKTFSIYY